MGTDVHRVRRRNCQERRQEPKSSILFGAGDLKRGSIGDDRLRRLFWTKFSRSAKI